MMLFKTMDKGPKQNHARPPMITTNDTVSACIGHARGIGQVLAQRPIEMPAATAATTRLMMLASSPDNPRITPRRRPMASRASMTISMVLKWRHDCIPGIDHVSTTAE
jgi:hypothetical protein